MAYDVKLRLPEGWLTQTDTYIDESGAEVTHISTNLPGKTADQGMMDIYVGAMPEDTTAEDQAFSNYADIVGFDEDDPEDFNPIEKIKFNGKPAFAFEALCEDDSPMRFISQEIKQGVLAILCVAALTDEKLEEFVGLAEKGLRI